MARNWNRAIAMAGLEVGEWALMFRPRWRIPESSGVNDKPDVENNLGRAEAMIWKRWDRSLVALQVRHSLRAGSNASGSAEMDRALPISGNLKGQVQSFGGCGEQPDRAQPQAGPRRPGRFDHRDALTIRAEETRSACHHAGRNTAASS